MADPEEKGQTRHSPLSWSGEVGNPQPSGSHAGNRAGVALGRNIRAQSNREIEPTLALASTCLFTENVSRNTRLLLQMAGRA